MGIYEVMKGPFNLILKYLSAIRTFAPQDVTFNGVGAFIRAGHMPKLISPRVFMIALFYLDLPMGQTWEALTFNLPKNSYIFVVSTSIWKNTMVGLEYRHDINCSRTTTVLARSNW